MIAGVAGRESIPGISPPFRVIHPGKAACPLLSLRLRGRSGFRVLSIQIRNYMQAHFTLVEKFRFCFHSYF
jgi:hypothetical protein